MIRKVLCALALAVFSFTIMPAAAQQQQTLVFGLILVGPRDDQGWSQSHFEAGRYIERTVPRTRMVFAENVNGAAPPDVTLRGIVADMVSEGARIIFATSDVFAAELNLIALEPAYANVVFIHISGDDVLTGDAPPNVGNLMGQMEWGKMIAGCAAALATRTGSIGYLGAANNFETRRFAASAYLGARYCYETYREDQPSDLRFAVSWIGFWFFIPDANILNPVDVANNFFDNGADVVISGIDTPEVVEVAGERAEAGQSVWAIPFDYADACHASPEVCLGVPYFHWGPTYVNLVTAVRENTWAQSWDWIPPTWPDILDAQESIIGFKKGDALSEELNLHLDDFINKLAEYAENPFVPQSIALWRGPLTLLNGRELALQNQIVSPLDIWYLPDLLRGMTISASSR